MVPPPEGSRPLPEGWVALPEGSEGLETELRRELPRTHQLFGRDLRAVARSTRNDDVLFQARTGDGEIFVVHLTWRRESNPTWPWTVAFRDIDDFVERWAEEEEV